MTAATPVALLLIATLGPRTSSQRLEAVDSPIDLHAFDGGLLVAYRAAFAVTIGAVVVAAASLVVRFRRARGVERQQLRWVASATILVALLSVVNLAARRWAPMLWRRWRVVSIRRSCRRRSGRPSCGIGCTTWTASSAGPWPTGS